MRLQSEILKKNDIAIVTLDSPVKYTKNVAPICLVPIVEASRRRQLRRRYVKSFDSLKTAKVHSVHDENE